MGADLTLMATDEAVRGFWQHVDLPRRTREERLARERGEPVAAHAAREVVFERMRAGGRQAVDLVVALLAARPDEDGASVVGAGPLEELLHAHGDVLADDLAARVRSDQWVARALHAVWLGDGALSEPSLRVLSPWLRSDGDPTGHGTDEGRRRPAGAGRRRGRDRAARLPRPDRSDRDA